VNVKAEGSMDSSNKRRKIGGPSSSATPEPTHKQNAGSVIASATIDTTVDTQGQPMKEGEARPKRQAAMHRPDYHALHHHISTPTAKWLDLIGNPEKYGTKITEGNFPKIPGSMITRAWIESAGKGVKAENGSSSDLDPTLFYGPTREPLIITKEAGGFSSLGGKIPGDDFTVADVARLVGPDKMVDVIGELAGRLFLVVLCTDIGADVATQQSAQWTLQKWAAYVESQFKPKIKNDSHHGGPNGDAPGANGSGPSSSSNQPVKIYNVISLEITGTELANQVKPPTLVSEIDWVDNFWDFGPGGKSAAVAREMRAKSEREVNGEAGKTNGSVVGEVEKKGKAKQQWPKVQLYCLVSQVHQSRCQC
jgi:F-box/leucine-rich repeat protein 10/11